MSIELKQAAQDAAEAIDWLLKNIRLDAPQLSGKAMGNAEKCASALRIALSQQPDNTSCKSVQKRLAAQQPATPEPVAWNSIQIASWIGSQLMHEPSMFERAAVCKFVRSLGRHPTLLKHSPAEGGEPYYGHQFKEIRKGVWLCKCGKQITEGATSCTNGTPNTSTQQQTADAVNATLTHADSCCVPRAQGSSIRVGSSQSDTPPASQEQAQQPIKDHQIAQIVNQLRDIAIEFGGTQQLRERIAVVIVPMLKAQQPATPEPVKATPYNPTEEMRWAMKRIDPALSSEQCRALWSAAWSAAPSTHPAPSVPDDVVRDAISTVREHYRGTDWGKAAESICDAIDAMLAAKERP